jgi:Peptidase family M28/PA domain
MKHRLSAALALAASVAVSAAPVAFADDDDDDRDSTRGLRKAVTTKGINEHLKAFQFHGDINGGNRAGGSPGYEASANYVTARLERKGYEVTDDFFEFVYNADVTPPLLTVQGGADYVDGNDFASMTFSPNGDTTAQVVAVDLVNAEGQPDNTSSSGCQTSDFAGFPAGAIALVQRGNPVNPPTDPPNGAAGCSFELKGRNAAAAGASGVIVMNEGNAPGRRAVVQGTLGAPVSYNIPVVGATYQLGLDLTNGLAVKNGPTGKTARLKVERVNETRTTRNIIAELPAGGLDRRRGDDDDDDDRGDDDDRRRGRHHGSSRPSNVLVVGAHLDSVPRGPGINDNGSGSGSILEIAEEMAERDTEPRNTIRFMWYGAEEFGLLGSEAYVEELKQNQAEFSRIKAMLNFDMVASPNFVRFVYDGDNSAFPASPGQVEAGPPGSGEIESIFARHFSSQRLASAPTPFNGRSDYGPFIAEGIPAGGLFTGAEGTKTAEQASVYGGTANVAYDQCYHLRCDTLTNINYKALDQMSDAAAHTALTLAERDFRRKPLENPPPLASGPGDHGGGGGLHDHDHEEESH